MIEYKQTGETCSEILHVHAQYLEFRYVWNLCRDFNKGEIAVKRENELYLPMPAGFVLNPDIALANTQQSFDQSYQFDAKYNFIADQTNDDPNYHPNRQYSLYKSGAKVPSILSHTISGLLGLIIKKPMRFLSEEDTSDNYVLGSKTQDIEGFNESVWMEKIRKTITTDLTFGRCFVTINDDNTPVIYGALDAPNWSEGEYVVFLETTKGYEQDPTGKDPREYVRISFLNGTTYYERFDSAAKLLKRETTTKYKELPIQCIGSTDLDWDVDDLPLEGIANCASHIYKKTADLSYSEFSSCVPTMIITGVDDGENKQVGGGVALVIPNEQAKVYYATTDSNALQHVKLHIDALFDEAKSYGASLLGGDKDEVESAEAIRLRQAASGASLSTLTRNIELGYNKLLKMAGFDIVFKINFDLSEEYITPQEQKALLDSWMANGISYTTYFNNLQKAGIIEDERSIEDEKSEIEEAMQEKADKAKELMEEQREYDDANQESESSTEEKKDTSSKKATEK